MKFKLIASKFAYECNNDLEKLEKKFKIVDVDYKNNTDQHVLLVKYVDKKEERLEKLEKILNSDLIDDIIKRLVTALEYKKC